MTPWTAACQASLSITNSQSLLRLRCIESVMPSSSSVVPFSSCFQSFPTSFSMSQLFASGGHGALVLILVASILFFFFGEGNGTLLQILQYSCLENPMDGGTWWAAVHGVTRSRTRLSDFTFTFHFHALEKEMATHSNVLAWRIPGTGEPGGLPSMGSHRVWHDWSDLSVALENP